MNEVPRLQPIDEYGRDAIAIVAQRVVDAGVKIAGFHELPKGTV